MKVLLTGGHITPLLATVEELRKEKVDCVVVTRKYAAEGTKAASQESKILEAKDIRSVFLTTGRLQRHFTMQTIPSLLRIPVGLFQAMGIVSRERPDVIVSFGGYLSVPIVIAGWLYRIPSITHEQSVRAGLANRINAKFASKIALSWKQSEPFFPKQKTVLTGNPVRSSVTTIHTDNLTIATFLMKESQIPLIFVTGGNQGSHAINEVVFASVKELTKKYRIMHQTGNTVARDVAQSKILAADEAMHGRYFATPFIGDEAIGAVFHHASLIIGRSGANTVTEIATLGKVAIFIPIPWAQQQEQLANASILVEAGSALVLSQEELTPDALLKTMQRIASGYEVALKRAKGAQALVPKNAASLLAKEIRALAHQ